MSVYRALPAATSDNRRSARVTVLRLITGRGHLIRSICARCRPDLADERTTVPVDTAEGGQVVWLTHLLRLNPPDGRSSHIEWCRRRVNTDPGVASEF